MPPDVKIRPYYDRSDLVKLTVDTVEDNLLRGMILVLIVLIFFLASARAAIITALTIPLALLFAFIILHARNIPANLLSIGAIDFGIIIDGTVVMVENIYRELDARRGQIYNLPEVIVAAAKDVDRPIFYSVAVIIAGYLPIYVLHGPSGLLFHPMADTMSFALIGALMLTLTLVPVLASLRLQEGRGARRPNIVYEWLKSEYGSELGWCLNHPWITMLIATADFRRHSAPGSLTSAASSCRTSMKARYGCAPPCHTPSPLRKPARSVPQIRHILMSYPQVTVVGSELGRPDDGTDPTGFFNVEFYVGLKPYKDSTWSGKHSHQGST